MNRTFESFAVADITTFKNKMLNWANRFNIFCLLDNHQYDLSYHSHECLLAAGTVKTFTGDTNFFASLELFYNQTNDWIFGHFNYDLKNKIEELTSANPDEIKFADAFLFVPEILIQLDAKSVSIGVFKSEAKVIFDEIISTLISPGIFTQVTLQPKIKKEDYIARVEQLREHIKRGDCYEINFCQEFYARDAVFDPIAAYKQLVDISPTPFATLYKIHDKYLLCASPERYLKKIDNNILSQPIKGTAQRDAANSKLDLEYKNNLTQSAKNRSENIMIVDLVRNDLSKVCREGSVDVENLYDVQTFPNVYQMVSTIKGDLKEDVGFSEIIKATFPMGSMTGAPKKRVMQLIELYEKTKRGIYSGTVGYITPEKNFDFNVVIRSLMFNATGKYLSCQVGGAITYNSNAEEEYQECLVKISAIKKVLQSAAPFKS